MKRDDMKAPTETVEELIGLTGVVLAQTDLPSTLEEICRIATRAVPGADGASVTTLNQGRPAALASDDWALGLDELQFAEHEGPCLDAYRTGNAFRVGDLLTETRWPSYAPLAAERGARSMVSLPMTAEGMLIGALNLYCHEPDAFDADAVSIAEVVAAHAGLASHVAAAFFRHRDLADQLGQAIQSRSTIEQAKGILMASRRCDPDEAFALLVDLSSRSHRKLREVAESIVADIGGKNEGNAAAE
jgi:GAF domain-containing protein